jgi:malonyl-CoA O-methyltransferase
MLISQRSQIAQSFGKAAQKYDANAGVQKQAGALLSKQLASIGANLPAGPALELGCGTGIFTAELMAHCPDRKIIVSDIAPPMLEACKTRLLNSHANLQFEVIDANDLADANIQERRFALIVCAFSCHWLNNISLAFDGIMQTLVPGGYFLFSLPTDGSFPEWKTACDLSGMPFTGNKLPSSGSISNYSVARGYSSDLHITQIRETYAKALDFYNSLKSLGASTRTEQSPSAKTFLRPLLRKWDAQTKSQITITYDILYGFLRKPPS